MTAGPSAIDPGPSRFVHDEVTRNGEAMTCQQYAQFIADDVEAIPDLRYTIDQLVFQRRHTATT